MFQFTQNFYETLVATAAGTIAGGALILIVGWAEAFLKLRNEKRRREAAVLQTWKHLLVRTINATTANLELVGHALDQSSTELTYFQFLKYDPIDLTLIMNFPDNAVVPKLIALDFVLRSHEKEFASICGYRDQLLPQFHRELSDQLVAAPFTRQSLNSLRENLKTIRDSLLMTLDFSKELLAEMRVTSVPSRWGLLDWKRPRQNHATRIAEARAHIENQITKDQEGKIEIKKR